jgi:hypothetical protein
MLLLVLLLMLVALPVSAQDDDEDDDSITQGAIFPDTPIFDTITDAATFDRFVFSATPGARITLTMTAAGGLAPEMGIVDASGNLLASTETDPEGNVLPPAEPNSTLMLEFIVPEAGDYIVVATREGRAEGTTTGSYTLVLRGDPRPDPREMQPVEFRCEDALATTAATIDFAVSGGDYQFTVYGFDGFEPAIVFQNGPEGEISDCDAGREFSAAVTLPGADEAVVDPPVARYTVQGGRILREVRLRIGTQAEVAEGRFLLVIEGLTLDDEDDLDAIEMRLGPLAIEGALTAYMLTPGASRIDPVMETLTDTEAPPRLCDDAGRDDCDEVPTLDGAGVIPEDADPLQGDRLDAGLRFEPGSVEPVIVGLRSRNPRATGAYVVFVLGEMPVDDDEE